MAGTDLMPATSIRALLPMRGRDLGLGVGRAGFLRVEVFIFYMIAQIVSNVKLKGWVLVAPGVGGELGGDGAGVGLVPEATLFVLGVAELLKEFFLLAGEVAGGFDEDGDDMGAAVTIAAHQGNAVAG